MSPPFFLFLQQRYSYELFWSFLQVDDAHFHAEPVLRLTGGHLKALPLHPPYLEMCFRLLLLSRAGGRGGRRLAPWGRRGAVGDAASDAHLRNELGLAEGAHVAGQHCRAAQEGPWPAGVVGGDLRVDHLLDLKEEDRAF